MAISINTNVTSLQAQRTLNNANASLANSMERLSTGLAINRAKDNAAGLAIAKRMEKNISGLAQANKNGNNGISVIQNTEAVFEEVNNNLQRMRELAVQASNETYTASDRSAMSIEYTALRDEIQRVAVTTDYNGIKLSDGSSSSVNIQIGSNNTANDRINIKLANLQTSASGLNVNGTSLASAGSAQATLDRLDSAIDSLSASRAQLGSDQARLETAVKNNVNSSTALVAARSAIMDVDFAQEVSNLAKNSVLTQASTAMLSQANTLPNMALSLL